MNEFFDYITFNIENRPQAFGPYHLVCLFAVITLCALSIIFRKKLSDKFVNNTLIVVGAAYIILEIYKQIIFVYNEWQFTNYSWYIFPMAFCSTPLYLTMLAGILKKGKFYDYITSYLAIYAMFAGLCVMALPGDVLIRWGGINFQTMFLHGGMIVIAFLLLATNRVSPTWKTFLKSTIVFGVFLSIALIMNFAWPLLKIDALFNMFQLSPYYTCSLPVLNTIQANAPYIVFLLAYVVGFIAVAALIFAIYKLIVKISTKKA